MNKEMIHSLINKPIQINRGSPEFRVGKVMAVANDYITLLTEDDGVVYYQTHHIKNISDNAKIGWQFSSEVPEDFEFMQGKDLKNVLEGLRYYWLRINHGRPDTLEGVLDDVTDDFIVVIANEEIIRISLYHLHNFSYGLKIEDSQNSKQAYNVESKKQEVGNRHKEENKNKKEKDKDKVKQREKDNKKK